MRVYYGGKFYEKCMQEDNKYQTFAVANYILDKLNEFDITHLKLQKLLYIAYGINLCLFESRLFESKIKAWKLGPVVEDVYQDLRQYGSESLSGVKLNIGNRIPRLNEQEFDTKAILIACAAYGQRTAWELVEELHSEGSAWGKHYTDGQKAILPDGDIRTELYGHLEKLATYLL